MSEWIEKNIVKMMNQIMSDARFGRPMPLAITLHGTAYRKFVEILKTKSAYHPDATGDFNFIGVPVHINGKLPFGTFTVERFSTGAKLLAKR